MLIEVWTDGSCDLNSHKSPGGWGLFMIIDGQEESFSGGEYNTTNNRMELMAAIKALEYIPVGHNVVIYTDSQYVKNGITTWIHSWKRNGWTKKGGPIKNLDLWKHLDELNAKHNNVAWQWVKGHSNNRGNIIADELAGFETKKLKNKLKHNN